jgi:nitrogenase molybdenum-iron protein NifN
MFSPADIRYLKEIFDDFDLPATILPDYSDTLDGPLWEDYQLIPRGGTPLTAVRKAGQAAASIEFSFTNEARKTAAALLSERCGVPGYRLGLPIGVTQTDELFALLSTFTGRPAPEKHRLERGRLLDSFVDAHKHLYGKRAAVFGEEDLVAGIASLLADMGVIPVLCISGGKSGRLRRAISEIAPDLASEIDVRDGVDFAQFDEVLAGRNIDLLIGNSKGYPLARRLEVPLLRVGFPIHDRVGGARLLHVGYRGAQQLFDRITNALIDQAQNRSPVGYAYM